MPLHMAVIELETIFFVTVFRPYFFNTRLDKVRGGDLPTGTSVVHIKKSCF